MRKILTTSLLMILMLLGGCFQNTPEKGVIDFKLNKLGWVISNVDNNYDGFGGCFYKFWLNYEGNITLDDIEYAKVRLKDEDYEWTIKIEEKNFNQTNKYIGGSYHLYYTNNNKYTLPIGTLVAEVKIKNGQVYTIEQNIPKPGCLSSENYKYVYTEDNTFFIDNTYTPMLKRTYDVTGVKDNINKSFDIKFKINDDRTANGYLWFYDESGNYAGITKMYYNYETNSSNWNATIKTDGTENQVEIKTDEISYQSGYSFENIKKFVIVIRDGKQYNGFGYDCEAKSGKIIIQ